MGTHPAFQCLVLTEGCSAASSVPHRAFCPPLVPLPDPLLKCRENLDVPTPPCKPGPAHRHWLWPHPCGPASCRPPPGNVWGRYLPRSPAVQATASHAGDRGWGQGTCSARLSLVSTLGRAGAAACVRWGELRPAVTVNSQCKLWSLNLAVSVTLGRVRLGLSGYL